MPTPTLDTRPDGSLVIEADSAAEALTLVGERLGGDAEIVSAEKVHRGGWKGFFAREVVQLVARERGTVTGGEPRAEAPPADTPADTLDGGLAAVLARMTEAADVQEESFQQVLAREFAVAGAAIAAPGPRVEPAVTVPAPDPAPEPSTESVASAVPAAPATVPGPSPVPGVAWSVEHLRELRLPESIVAGCEGLDPAHDAAWVMAIAAAVSSWCRPLPTRDSVLIGPRSHRLAAGLGHPAASPGTVVTPEGTVALKVTDSAAGRRFVDGVRGERWSHLVVGGSRWEGYLLTDVTAVSWVGDESLPVALEAASRLGLILGYGLGDATGQQPVRATPLDVAIAIRSLLPRA